MAKAPGLARHGRPCWLAAPLMRAEAGPLTHRQKRLIVISMMLPVFLGSIDQSILASALPTIGRVFGEVHNLPWLITAYLIAATATHAALRQIRRYPWPACRDADRARHLYDRFADLGLARRAC